MNSEATKSVFQQSIHTRQIYYIYVSYYAYLNN